MMALEPAPSDASRPINGGIECLEQDVEDAQSTDEELDAGDASDEDSDMGSEDYADDLKTRLQQSLDDIQHQGTFASFRTQSAYINPGLYVNEIGSIGLPLSVRDAQAIAGVCKKSPFGKGDATLVDETVRKTWELETSEIACRNPAWAQYLDGLARQAIQHLGVQVPAWAQPYKLLLYEEGAFFKIHRDTEKVPGMFGTLVVCLPSEHAGGEVLLVHGKKKRTIKTATSSAFELSALAWYSDVQHEIRPITSGYRMVLTYNLVQDKQQPKQTATGLDAHQEQLERSLRRWNSHLPPFDYLVYPLEHLYTPSGLSLLHLKGQDAAKGRSLEQLCSKNNFYWFLARMTKSEQEDFNDEDDLEEDMVVDRVVTPAGKSIILNTRWPPPEQILADVETLYARDPDSEDEGEFTGNENMPSTCRYYNTVAILMRKADVLESFSTQSNHSSTSLLALFDLVHNDSCCSARHRRKAMSIVLQRSLQKFVDNDTRQAYWLHNLYIPSSQAAAENGEVFTQVSEYCYSADMGDLVSSTLRTTMAGRAWWNSKELRTFVGIQLRKEMLEGKDNVWDSWLSEPLPTEPTYKYANEKRTLFDSVEELLPHATVPSFKEWKAARVVTLIQSIQAFTIDDAEPLLALIPVMAPEIYFEVVIPTLVRCLDSAGMSRLLCLLSVKADRDVLFKENFEKPTYQRLIPYAAPALRLSPDELTKSFRYMSAGGSLQSLARDEFLAIVTRCMKLCLKEEARLLLSVCLPELPELGSTWWREWRPVFMFVEALVDNLGRHDATELSDAASEFVKQVLQRTSRFLAFSRPKQPNSWAQHDVRRNYATCRGSCEPCRAVKTFLESKTQTVGRFSYKEEFRKHIEYSFNDGDDFKFETEKTRSPYTLVIYKTNNAFAKKLQRWKTDVHDLWRMLLRLNIASFIKSLIGDVLEVAGLRNALVEAAAMEGVVLSSPETLQPMSASAQNRGPSTSTVGTKMKISAVIDLTEE